ncbi:LrgB family protein [Methylobrevis pamukkalensis]|uniref:Inner membrane protein YohK n=1 Tax=Methylobrevis pamukkalensis TaxID=1439726 RepID=A0A1E3H371_9HYPH|nr:LrgB family protein [Methylobrevis pamukkalensis]ODN70246.1 Inner membrane protein YohK [Methylobrevis pamukkalensis]
MSGADFGLWTYLAASPLLWLTLTLLVWIAADGIAVFCGRHPAVNPVLIAIVLVALILVATGTPYRVYFEGAQFIHFLLGPATVALAVPLYRNWRLVRRRLLPIAAALVAGSVTAVVSAVGLALLFGVPKPAVIAIAPKSVTAAIAMGVSTELGGDPALTAVLVIMTGVLGAVMVTPLMNALKIRDYAARGFAVGLAAHGIGTARAFTVDSTAGTFAGIGMALNAVMTALIMPVLLAFFF